jgi:excinuclease ABC subunit A
VIKSADYIIDLGPEGGEKGGKVIGYGPPEVLARNPQSYTGQYLKKKLLAKTLGK